MHVICCVDGACASGTGDSGWQMLSCMAVEKACSMLRAWATFLLFCTNRHRKHSVYLCVLIVP